MSSDSMEYNTKYKETGWIFLEEIHLAQSKESKAETCKHGYEAQVSINGRNILGSSVLIIS